MSKFSLKYKCKRSVYFFSKTQNKSHIFCFTCRINAGKFKNVNQNVNTAI